MKKCIGCGVVLQDVDPNKKGYVKNIEQDYCQRCFRLTHYNDLVIDMKDDILREDVLKELSKINDSLFVLVVDILNIEASLKEDLIDTLKNKDVLLVINKYDILPKNANIEKILKYIELLVLSKMKGIKVCDVLLTQKFDPTFKELFFESVDNTAYKNILFIGNVNAGKSTIVNKLIGDESLTVSRYPSTTLEFNEIKLGDYKLIDSPGLIDNSNLIMKVDQTNLKKILITSMIKPLVYQLYEEQSYFVDGILRLDVKNKAKNASIIFYMNPLLNVHRTKTINADKYEINHLNDYELHWHNKMTKTFIFDECSNELVINGLGVIAFKGIKEVKITCEENIEIDKRETVF